MRLYHYHPPGGLIRRRPSFSIFMNTPATLFSSNAHFDGLFLMRDLVGLEYPATLEGWTRNCLEPCGEFDFELLGIIEWSLLVRQLGLSLAARRQAAVNARALRTKPTWWYGTPFDLSMPSAEGFFTTERYDLETRTWEKV